MRRLLDAEDLLQLLHTQPSVQDGPNEFVFRAGLVEVEKASFSYCDGEETIQNLSFHARPGQTIALVGEAGAGKSTILKLLFRFYDVSSGSISIDGQDIRSVTLNSLREQIGVVPEDLSLVNDSIMANIRYAKLDATDNEVMEACRAAAVHDSILALKHGYSTKISEHGIKLSGGELRRISMARVILKDPKIILFDEAISSMDSETEAKIQEVLTRLLKGRTAFVVAQRLSTAMNADRIIVIRNGSIAEQGTPRQLMKSKGKYHRLWARQLGLVDSGLQDNDDLTRISKAEQKALADRVDQKIAVPDRKGLPYALPAGESSEEAQPTTQPSDSIPSSKQAPPQSKQKGNRFKRSLSETSIEDGHMSSLGKGKTNKKTRNKAPSAASTLFSKAQNEKVKETMSSEARDHETEAGMRKEGAQEKEANEKWNSQSVSAPAANWPNVLPKDAAVSCKKDEPVKDLKENAETSHATVQELGNKLSTTQQGQETRSVEKPPLAKAVHSMFNQQVGPALHSGDMRSLASIEETEEEPPDVKSPKMKGVAFSEIAECRNSLAARIGAAAEKQLVEATATKASALELPESGSDAKVDGKATESASTGLLERKSQANDSGASKKQAEKRSFSGRKSFKPRPEAPPFIPKSQRRGGKSSQTTESGSSSQDASEAFEGMLQQSGNIMQDTSARRIQAKSDPTGQSLKKLHDDWVAAGLRENFATPSYAEIQEMARIAEGPSGHVVSRSTPLGGNRRRSRAKKRGSSMGSDSSMPSAVGAGSPPNVAPTPPMLIAPNTTPTGLLTPAGNSPHRPVGEVHAAPNAK